MKVDYKLLNNKLLIQENIHKKDKVTSYNSEVNKLDDNAISEIKNIKKYYKKEINNLNNYIDQLKNNEIRELNNKKID